MASRPTYVGDRNGVILANAVVTDILEHVLDEHGALGDNTVCSRLSQHHVQKFGQQKLVLAARGAA